MNTTRFYGHFAAAYGSCWLLLLLAAVVTQSHIDLGELGFYGFPAISLVYAYLRYKGNQKLGNAILEIGKCIDSFTSKVSNRYFSKKSK